ncbi:MAG TPA: (Fe-S)-binding protein [Solirubrobacteraceae bacterium]|nr:(Fe-S)-binding protein [Solirubrobacteraceae bacterium]
MLDLPSLADHLDDCVHCGLCLADCPTYLLWGQEADSPRGRITQVQDALLDGAGISPAMVGHMDACVGCLACVSACPAGVAYDRILAEARTAIEHTHRRSAAERALRLTLFETLPFPERLRNLVPALAAMRRLSGPGRRQGRLAQLAAAVPDPPSREERELPIPAFTPARGERRGQVGLLLGCVQRVFFPAVHRATIGLLTAEGYDVHAPRLPDCCGALELSAGEREHALARAQATLAAFAELGELDAVIANAAGCGTALKDYGALVGSAAAWDFAGRVRDIQEFLAAIAPRAPRGPLPLRVVLHDACQLSHGQGVVTAPRALLRAIPELELLEVPHEAQICCGAAGLYPVLAPEPAAQLGRRKAQAVLAAGGDVLAAASPGCLTQLGRHLRELGAEMEIRHPVELLWRSVQAA